MKPHSSLKSKHFVLNLLLVVSVVNIVYGQLLQIPKTPCKTVFNYRVRNGTNEVYGYLKFENDLSGDYQLEIRMSVAKAMQSNIRIVRMPSEESIQCGEDLEYEVLFPPSCDNIIPVLNFVKFNKKIYCTGSQDIHNKITTQFQEFDALVTEIEELSACDQPKQTTVEQGQVPMIPSSTRMTTETPSIIRNEMKQDPSCGLLDEIAVGAKGGREHFPWLATLYYLSRNDKYPMYRCSGTLISKTHVVTVAHCLIGVETKNLTIRLGRNSIKQIVPPETTTIRQVIKITLHPDYNTFNQEKFHNGNNIAIMELKEAVEYEGLVKPACLWSGSTELADIVGTESLVIGYDANAKPTKFIMPIVSYKDCAASHEYYRGSLSFSNTYFCAGKRDGIVPCVGNSGGSLSIKRKDGRYYLRGLTTLGIISNGSCDGSHYILFTDVAKFGNWISSVITPNNKTTTT